MPWVPLRDADDWAPRRVGEDLDALFRRSGAAGSAAPTAVWAHWDEAVGPAVAAHARPLAVKGSTLVVGVDTPAYATQLRLLAPQLLKRVAEFAGREAISAIEVTVRP